MIRSRFVLASVWLVLVLFLGSASFSAQETGRFVLPALKLLMPGAPFAQLHGVHLVLRKLAHLTEYAVLALLWFKAVHGAGGRTPRSAACVALSICLLCAFADEVHQSTLPSRQGSARDVLIDGFGAIAMLTLERSRQTARDRQGRLGQAVAAESAD